MSEILKTEGLCVSADEKELLHSVDISVGEGETHVLMGHNGAGKSTFGCTVMGSPEYTVTSGKIIFDGEDITSLSADKRAKKGIFLSFQSPVEIPGITLSEFLRNAQEQVSGKRIKLWDFKKQLKAAMELIGMDSSYADRDLNVGFSGGEKKKAEILQLLILKPRLAILDETDSGLDVDAVKTVSKGIEEYRKSVGGTLLIITHNAKILEALSVDRTHILKTGRVAEEGGGELALRVLNEGFEKVLSTAQAQ